MPRNVRIAGVNPDHLKVCEGDVYGICQRVQDEISPNLRIVIHETHSEPFVVMEDCIDGEVRFVARYAELDARILEDLRRMMNVPYADRFAESVKAVEAHNAKLEAERFETDEFDEFVWHFKNDLKKLNRNSLKGARG